MIAWLLLAWTIFLGGMVGLVAHYWKECSEPGDGHTREWFTRWLRRGVLVPLVVWVILNLGVMPFIPPLVGYVAQLRANGGYLMAMYFQTALAASAIIPFWSAMTFGWLLTGLFKRARNRDELIVALIVWSPVALAVGWAFHALLGWMGFGFAAVLWLWPLAQYVSTVVQTVRPTTPTYSHAIGKIKFGKYSEAEMAIIGELEKCATSFDGWMMLAELYANQFHDLPEAEKTITDLCEEPTTSLSQVSIALHRLADWHLKLGGNPVAARRALEKLCARMPGTHLALMARQRIAQLPGSREEFAEQQKPHTVAMPALNDSLDEPAAERAEPVNTEAALAAVNQLVARLNQDPNDTTSREKLARLFAGDLGQLDLAMEQLELLAGMPDQPESKLAEWLALMAAWQIKLRGEGDAARKILERLIRQFPSSAQAFAAQRRLALMDMNAKMKRLEKQKTEGGK